MTDVLTKEQIRKLTKKEIQILFLSKSHGITPKKISKYNITSEELYLIYHSTETPLCGCGKKCQFKSFKTGFYSTCRTNCAHSQKLSNKKRENTNLKKYGVKHVYLNKEIQEKQKHKLKDRLNKYNHNLSEKQNMFNNGYRRIYDSGNIKYKLKAQLNEQNPNTN